MMEGFCLAMKSFRNEQALFYRMQYFEYQIMQIHQHLQNPVPTTPSLLDTDLRLLTVI